MQAARCDLLPLEAWEPSVCDGRKLGADIMTIFWLALIANTVTLVVAIVSACLRPTLFYRLVAGVAICAFLTALHQVATARYSPLALPFTGLLIVLLYCQRIMNLSRMKKN